MKTSIERRKPEGLLDYLALALTTWGVGYFPIAPGTWGSAVGVMIYLGAGRAISSFTGGAADYDAGPEFYTAVVPAMLGLSLLLLSLTGIWASGRSAALFGNSDPSHAVVDEVVGQLITFLFVPFSFAFAPLEDSWRILLAGFLLFRLFDIWKPYPIDDLQNLPGGIGICADDMVAGVYAGVCLSILYAISLSL